MKQPAPTIIVSDHALVRYLERVLGYDVEAVRRKIEAAVKPLGAGTGRRNLKTAAGTFVLSGNHVTTVLRPEMRAVNGFDVARALQKDARP